MMKFFITVGIVLLNAMLVFSEELFSVWRLSFLIRHKTDDLYFTDDMDNYGCWCGRTGRGTPMDQLDRCCYTHKRCIQKYTQCPLSSIYYRTTQCEGDRSINCDDEDTCKRLFCICDVKAVNCLLKHKPQYNATLKHGNKKLCEEGT